MKRLTLLCIALWSFTMLRANVISGTCGDNLTWQYDTDDHSLVISGTGDMYDYDEYELPCPWKTVAETITSVSLPNGLTHVGSHTFEWCYSVKDIDFPTTLTSIGYYSFRSTGLKSITIPNSVTEIGSGAFAESSYLQSVVLPNNIQNLESYVFGYCHQLKSITIPASVTTIGANALYYCEDIYLESSTPAIITNSSFKSDVVVHVPCNSVNTYQSAPIWQFLTIMGNMDYEFNLSADEGGTASITNSVCAANTVVIEATADAGWHFTGWSDGNTDNPRAIVLTADKSVTAQFERSNTYYQVNITGISYLSSENYHSNGPSFSEQIMEGTYIYFRGITDCGTFTGWSDGVAEIERSIRITSDTTITAYYEGIETYNVSITAGEHGSLTNEIVGTVTSCTNTVYTNAIADEGYHFVEWSDGYEYSWREFYITSDLSVYAIFAKGEDGGKLGEHLYWSFEADKNQITVTGSGEMTEHEYFSDIDHKKDNENIIHKVQTLIFEEGATSVIAYNFNGLHYLETIALPASLITIGESSFEDCRSLSQVTFAANSSLTSIGNWAFYNCHELQNLVIPEGVTEIGKAAFYGCAYLKDVTLPASIQAIGDNAFALCAKMEKLQVAAVVPPAIAAKTFEDVSREMPVYVPEASVDAYKADPYWGELNIIGGLSAVETVESAPAIVNKVLRDGQIFIIRGDKTYTVQGQEVK